MGGFLYSRRNAAGGGLTFGPFRRRRTYSTRSSTGTGPVDRRPLKFLLTAAKLGWQKIYVIGEQPRSELVHYDAKSGQLRAVLGRNFSPRREPFRETANGRVTYHIRKATSGAAASMAVTNCN